MLRSRPFVFYSFVKCRLRQRVIKYPRLVLYMHQKYLTKEPSPCHAGSSMSIFARMIFFVEFLMKGYLRIVSAVIAR